MYSDARLCVQWLYKLHGDYKVFTIAAQIHHSISSSHIDQYSVVCMQ